MNIYVGNLPFRLAESELREAFEQFGEVSRAKIIKDRETNRSKGFAFVEMSNDDEAPKDKFGIFLRDIIWISM